MSNMAIRKDPTGLRRQRIQKIHTMLEGTGKADLPRLLATCQYQMGLTEKKIREYLGILESLGFVVVNDLEGWVEEVVEE